MKTAAEALIEFLAAQGVDRAFCVPGESYIALLDALPKQLELLDLHQCELGADGLGALLGRDDHLIAQVDQVIV